MDRTTIQVKKSTLQRLRDSKMYERESYDELLKRLLKMKENYDNLKGVVGLNENENS